jgi:5-methylcytosine-specific restriction endonuclease McrA
MGITDLSNAELLADLRGLLAEESRITAKIIAYLVEVEERRLHLEAACSSMFDFCVRKLGLSEGETHRRLTAARLAKRFPVLLDALASRRIHLSSLVLLRDLFTDDNVERLLAAAEGKTKREMEQLVARLAPKPDVESSIRKLPEARVRSAAPLTPLEATQASLTPLAAPAPRAHVVPLSEGRHKVQFTASDGVREKLEHARALLSHRNPSGDLAVVIEKALDVLIAKLENERHAKTDRPRAAKPSRKPGYVSRATRREVAARDGLQCSYVSPDGERCPSRVRLEVDHRHARALGGAGTVENTRMLCAAHNHYAAEKTFGRAHVAARINLSRRKCRPTLAIDDRLRQALRSMGLRAAQVEHAVAAIEAWERPIEELLREALGLLT